MSVDAMIIIGATVALLGIGVEIFNRIRAPRAISKKSVQTRTCTPPPQKHVEIPQWFSIKMLKRYYPEFFDE